MQDLSNRIKIDRIIPVQNHSGTSVTSDNVDCSEFDAVMIQIMLGAIDITAGQSISFKLEHSDTETDGDFVAVTANDVANIKTVENGIVFLVDGTPLMFPGKGGNPTTDGLNYIFSYVGPKRYIRIIATETGLNTFVYGANSVKSIAQNSDSNIIMPHPTEFEFYADGTISIDSNAGTTVNGRGTVWIGNIDPGDSLEFSYSRIAYNTGTISTEYPIGTTDITFTGTTFVTTWGNPKLYVDTQGTGEYTDIGDATIVDATNLTVTATTEDISSTDNWYVDYDRSTTGTFNGKVTAVSNDNTITIGTAFTETVFFQNYRIYFA